MGTVVVDACLVITFGSASRLDLLAGTTQRRMVIPPTSVGEVVRPPASLALADALKRGLIASEGINLDDAAEQEALRVANTVPAFRDRGDAEVLALASSRGWIVGSDDQAIRKHATKLIGSARLAGTLDILVWAVREKRLTVTGAEELLGHLDVGSTIAAQLESARLTFADIL